jgi:allantoinase
MRWITTDTRGAICLSANLLVWPHQAKVALMITIPVEFFPLNPVGKPFKAPGSMVTAYPDFRHYTTRDYGNRVGIFRLLKVLDEFNLKANFAVNSEVASRYPALIEEILKNGHEIIAHGVDMDELHYGGMDSAHEAYLVEKSLDHFAKNFRTKDIKDGCHRLILSLLKHRIW